MQPRGPGWAVRDGGTLLREAEISLHFVPGLCFVLLVPGSLQRLFAGFPDQLCGLEMKHWCGMEGLHGMDAEAGTGSTKQAAKLVFIFTFQEKYTHIYWSPLFIAKP